MSIAAAVHAKACELGKYIVRMTTTAGSGHPSSALSLVHIVIALMYKHMRWDPADPWNPDADRLVLSEGHAVPVVYAAYADLGGVVGTGPADKHPLRIEDLNTLRDAASVLDGHPNPAEGFPFFDAATGSLGQGLSVAAGLGLAARLRKSERRIYTLIGDGESREGQIWEALDFIVDQRLHNVTAIFNCNGQGQADYVSVQQSPDALAAKLSAFGWEPFRVEGHDPDILMAMLARASKSTRPAALVAVTEKGWGVSGLKAKSNHGKPIAKADLPAALESLDATCARLAPGAPRLDWRPAPSQVSSPPRMPRGGGGSRESVEARGITIPPFQQGLEAAGISVGPGAKIATRRAYGAALMALGRADERVVALDGDVSNSTFSELFAHHFPQRFFECKIAEQNMISAAVGLSAAGHIPFANSFAKFLSRGADQVEMAAITRANVKLVGSHAGVSLAADGPSQMGLPDVAFYRSFCTVQAAPQTVPRAADAAAPTCVYFQPADAVAAYRMTQLMAAHVGLCYMRTHRPDVPVIYPPDQEFEVGGANVPAQGSAVAIVTFDRLRYTFTRFHRHGAFIDYHTVIGKDIRDFAGNFFDETKIDISIRLLWGGHGNKNDLRIIDAFPNTPTELQPVGRHIAMNNFLEARLENWDAASLERLNLSCIVIDANDIVSDIGETRAGDKANVS